MTQLEYVSVILTTEPLRALRGDEDNEKKNILIPSYALNDLSGSVVN